MKCKKCGMELGQKNICPVCGFGEKSKKNVPSADGKKGEKLNSGLTKEKKAILDDLTAEVETLDLSVRAMNALSAANIRYIYELCQKSETEMLKICNYIHKTVNEIKDSLSEKSLQLGMSFGNELADAVRNAVDRTKGAEEYKLNLLKTLSEAKLKVFYTLLEFFALEAGTLEPGTKIEDTMELETLFPDRSIQRRVVSGINRSFQRNRDFYPLNAGTNASPGFYTDNVQYLTVAELRNCLLEAYNLDNDYLFEEN